MSNSDEPVGKRLFSEAIRDAGTSCEFRGSMAYTDNLESKCKIAYSLRAEQDLSARILF
jgi:hypothetical protein